MIFINNEAYDLLCRFIVLFLFVKLLLKALYKYPIDPTVLDYIDWIEGRPTSEATTAPFYHSIYRNTTLDTQGMHMHSRNARH